MKNELLHIGSLTIYGYGLMIALGILAAYFMMEYRSRKAHLPDTEVFGLVLTCAVSGLLGAKVLFLLTNLPDVIADPLFYLETFADGFVVYGGIIGGVLGGYIYTRARHLPFLPWFDLCMPSIAVAQGMGRIGCLLAGCCYGRHYEGPLHITFTASDFAPNGIPLYPTQIMSSLLNFAHALLLIGIARHKKWDGQVGASYLVFYSTGRFLMEFLRGDLERGFLGRLSTSQVIAIFILAAGAAMLMLGSREKRSGV